VQFVAVPTTSADLAARIAAVLEGRAEVLEAYLFGSAARDEARPHSDVDVAVYVDPEGEPPGSYGYAAELTALLMQTLGRNDVDVVILNAASPLL
jgi:predicted nucleotidyltransferase